ncbi:MAG: DUF3833 domain-containing protein [Rhodospirillaceae bacterium]|nr:DUF3833 domain-containing protein [Rhodospirillaceae bacterium]
MPRFKKLAAVAMAAFAVSACTGTMKPEDFAGKEPRFVLESYFSGSTKAWGMFEDRFGNLRRQFVVDINGTWDGEKLVLDERFVYSDGEKDRRVWTITKQDDNTYTGTAGDVIGTALGKSFGNALSWSYDMDLKVGDGTWRVHFDDWMFLQPDGVLLNRATVSKWGFHIGTVTLAFRRVEQSAAAINELKRAAE